MDKEAIGLSNNLEPLFADGWNESCDTAFNELKQRLVYAPVQGYPNFTKPSILETDASLQVLDVVLSLRQENGLVVLSYGNPIILGNRCQIS